MAVPTAFPELNAVLDELVTGVTAILVGNFCGAYLQGSFAVGDADEHSDVDFVVVTHGEVSTPQPESFQTLHKRLHALDVAWAKHLEGSYIPKDSLRRLDPARPAYLYLDNGRSELEWDNHDNTNVVRWSLREYGITLAGEDPRGLIDPVSTEQLCDEILATMHEWAPLACESQDRFKAVGEAGIAMSRWKQPYVVLSYCRMLHTLSSGKVASKKEGGQWAIRKLDPKWSGLIQAALDDRPNPWDRVHLRADSDAVDRTVAFVDYALITAAA